MVKGVLMIRDEFPVVGCMSYCASHDDGRVVLGRSSLVIINLWNNVAAMTTANQV